jgi:hypothetical protein
MLKNIIRIAFATALLLLIPLLAKWPWTRSDFVIMGILIFGTGTAYEVIVKKIGKKHRVFIGIFLLIVFILIWAELAVGLFGTPFAGS